MLAFLQNIGFPELLVILLIVLLLFGAARLPEIARSLGKSIQEFKKGVKEIERDVNDSKKV
ncbi:MAG: twin-arginine translocase TatA/TatE family subunit [Candidatus Omnitrophica bacterium]|nr:twin-arginine translocase TatA/TatE family subunit [Candidatus Omnitrophota bacterium]